MLTRASFAQMSSFRRVFLSFFSLFQNLVLPHQSTIMKGNGEKCCQHGEDEREVDDERSGLADTRHRDYVPCSSSSSSILPLRILFSPHSHEASPKKE